MDKKEISALILSGGASSRMGYPKALLQYKGKSFCDIIIDKINTSGISDVNLILGAESSRIEEQMTSKTIKILINKYWEQGQLSSLKCGLKNLSVSAKGVMVFLIDHPLVNISTITSLQKEFMKCSCDVVIPEYKGRGGHPIIYSRTVFEKLLALDITKGARALYSDPMLISKRIAVNDPYIKQDIDTMEEFKELIDGYKSTK